jgi:hypothetical protein
MNVSFYCDRRFTIDPFLMSTLLHNATHFSDTDTRSYGNHVQIRMEANNFLVGEGFFAGCRSALGSAGLAELGTAFRQRFQPGDIDAFIRICPNQQAFSGDLFTFMVFDVETGSK